MGGLPIVFDEREEDESVREKEEDQSYQRGNMSRRSHFSSFHILPKEEQEGPFIEEEEGQDTEKFDHSTAKTKKSSVSDIDKVLARCTHRRIVPLEDLYQPERLSSSRKVISEDNIFLLNSCMILQVGEGAFGEVFLLPSDEDEGDNVVVKIVPVNGDVLVNGQPQMKLIDMLAEIIISTELSRLSSGSEAPGFLTVLRCNLTEGRYPDTLLQKWDDYDREKGSENDRPDDSLFGDKADTQKFVSLELKNGGQDLENITLLNAAQGWAVFQQVAHATAIAEKILQFEHRDLHWGNVLVKSCQEKTIQYSYGQEAFEVETFGVRSTIIDFSLSRLSVPGNDKESCDIFNNLSEDPDLFVSEGDYQFDIYR